MKSVAPPDYTWWLNPRDGKWSLIKSPTTNPPSGVKKDVIP